MTRLLRRRAGLLPARRLSTRSRNSARPAGLGSNIARRPRNRRAPHQFRAADGVNRPKHTQLPFVVELGIPPSPSLEGEKTHRKAALYPPQMTQLQR